MDARVGGRASIRPAGPVVRLKERLTYEVGPLLAFFVAVQAVGIVLGTVVFMAATLVALAANLLRERRLPTTPLVSAGLVLVFGGVSLFFHEPWIIMIRPTVMNGVYALVLVGGLLCGHFVLRSVLKGSLVLDGDEAWRTLTLRAVAFLVLLATLNEITWRFFPVEVWAAFKAFAVLPLNVLFIAAQAPFVRRHRAEPPHVRA